MIADKIEMILVSRLVPAPKNVRKTNADAGHASLKASVRADGVRQNLVVHETDKVTR